MKLERFLDSIYLHYFGESKWEQIKEKERANPLMFNLKKVVGILLFVGFVIVVNLAIIKMLWKIIS
jgi:hypothetical protein